MKARDTMLAKLAPPEGIPMSEDTKMLIGVELPWQAVEPDNLREGHWLMQVVVAGKKYYSTSAYLNQTEAIDPAETITLQDIKDLTERLKQLECRRDALVEKYINTLVEFVEK